MLQSSKGSAKLPPGPEGRRLRNLHERLFACEALLLRLNKDYGDVVSWKLPAMDCCAIFDADLIQEVLIEKRPHFPRMRQLATQCTMIPNAGLARVNYDVHARKFKAVNAVFAEQRLGAYAEIMLHHLHGLQSSWRVGRTIDAKEEIYRVTARIMADSCVGGDLQLGQGLVRKALKGTKWDYGLDYLPLKSLLRRLPLPQNLSARRSFGAMHRIVNESMRRGRKPSNGRSDWVSCLVRDGSAASPPFSDEEVRDEAIDLLVGNLDPLAVALTWCLSYVARNPSVSERIEQEVDEVLGGRAMAAEDYDRLPYARAVFQESLRLAPPAFFMEREATEDCVLGGRHLVPKGTVVQLCMGIVHRKRKHFDQPDQFKPERWLHDPPPGCPAHVYMPFSYQPRRCAAWEFCTMTGTYLVASVAQRLRLEAATDRPVESDFKLLFAPKGPVPVLVTERESRTDRVPIW